MDLVKLESKLPLKAYPEQELNKIILTQLTVWLSSLLSLTDEVSANRLEIALPAIKEHCWSMGFDEVKKIFILYADGKLSVKPIPNYFDRILLGKIIEAYKETLKADGKMNKIDESEYKDLLDIQYCLEHFDNFRQNGKLDTNSFWIYSYLYDFKKIKPFVDFTESIKLETWEKYKDLDKPKEDKIIESKTEILRLFFERMVQTKIELKPLL